MDWKKNAIVDLRDYPYLQSSLDALPGEIKSLALLEEGMRVSDPGRAAVQGGKKGREEALAALIDQKERLKVNYLVTKAKAERIRRGLAVLTEPERKVLDAFYIARPDGHMDKLCEELGYEERNVYNIKEAALRKFTLAMFGVVDL